MSGISWKAVMPAADGPPEASPTTETLGLWRSVRLASGIAFGAFGATAASVLPQGAIVDPGLSVASGNQVVVGDQPDRYHDDPGEPPSYLDGLMSSLVSVTRLPPNWDGYGASRIDRELVSKAVAFTTRSLPPSGEAPAIVPVRDGTLQLEWHLRGWDIEVSIDRAGETLFAHDQNRGVEWEGPAYEGFRDLHLSDVLAAEDSPFVGGGS